MKHVSCFVHAMYIIVALSLMNHMLDLLSVNHNISHRRKRKTDDQLPYHKKRARVAWSPLVRSLGPDEFKIHHRISETLFEKIHHKIRHHIHSNPKYARRTCCRGGVSHVDSRSKLSMTLKHLAGSKTQDITRCHGVSRSTVVQSIRSTMDAIIEEFGIAPFPFDDEEALQKIADGFKSKSTGGLFENVVGAFDGYLLQISKRCIGKKSGIKDPSKYYCRKGYYAINCQVSCDSDRRVTSLSMLCPGAVPDRLAHLKGSMNRAIETGKLPSRFHFVGDNAYPQSDHMLTPYTRVHLRNDIHGWMDNYNFYLSQLRINIECTFGMITNKFPILQAALLTPKLNRACKTFTVCCILHNLCIDERLETNSTSVMSFETLQRYTQRSHNTLRPLVLDEDFEYVDCMDEVIANALIDSHENAGPQYVEDDPNELSVKEAMTRKIAARGYVRPRYKC